MQIMHIGKGIKLKTDSKMKNHKIHLQLNYKFWIETDNKINLLGEGKWKLLKAIRETRSRR